MSDNCPRCGEAVMHKEWYRHQVECKGPGPKVSLSQYYGLPGALSYEEQGEPYIPPAAPYPRDGEPGYPPSAGTQCLKLCNCGNTWTDDPKDHFQACPYARYAKGIL
jgi:hypothetical protein